MGYDQHTLTDTFRELSALPQSSFIKTSSPLLRDLAPRVHTTATPVGIRLASQAATTTLYYNLLYSNPVTQSALARLASNQQRGQCKEKTPNYNTKPTHLQPLQPHQTEKESQLVNKSVLTRRMTMNHHIQHINIAVDNKTSVEPLHFELTSAVIQQP